MHIQVVPSLILHHALLLFLLEIARFASAATAGTNRRVSPTSSGEQEDGLSQNVVVERIAAGTNQPPSRMHDRHNLRLGLAPGVRPFVLQLVGCFIPVKPRDSRCAAGSASVFQRR